MTHIEQRSDYAAIWSIRNPILNRGEVGWEEDTRRAKIGNGVDTWNSLPYANPGPEGPAGPQGPQGAQGPQGVQGPPGALTGTAGGDLVGSYPNPTIKSSVALGGNPTTTTQATATNNTTVATTAFVKNQAYAPLDSPALTGGPTAPTPATSDNDSSIATTKFVKDVIDALSSLPFAEAAGTVPVTFSATTQATASVSFPAGRFSQVPIVQQSIQGAGASTVTAIRMTGSATTSGYTCVVNTSASFTGTISIGWRAVQRTASSATG